MAYTLNDFLKANKNYEKMYDPTSGTAFLTNTDTGKQLSWKSGQGQEYGFGGVENGSNVISSLEKLTNYFGTPQSQNANVGVANTPPAASFSNSAPTPPPPTPLQTAKQNYENKANTLTNTQWAPNSKWNTNMEDLYNKMSNRSYASPYANQIGTALNQMQNYQKFNYDPNSDVGLQAAQTEAQDAVSRAAARKGMIYSDSNKAQMGKSALSLVPQFRQQAYQEYANDRSNLYNQLQALNQLENTNMQQYQLQGTDLMNMGNIANNLYSNDINAQVYGRNDHYKGLDVLKGLYDTAQIEDTTQYNRGRDTLLDKRYDEKAALDKATQLAELTGNFNPYYNVKITDEVLPYMGNLQAEIDRRASINPNDPLLQQLQASRYNKVFNNPELMSKYGSQYQTQSGRLNTANIKGQEMKNKMTEIDLQNYPEMTQLKVLGIKQDIENGQYTLAMNKIKSENLPKELALQLEGMALENQQRQAQIANTNKSTSLMGLKSGSSSSSNKYTTDDAMGNVINRMSGKSVQEVKDFLNTNKGNIVTDLGPDGWNDLWNTLLYDAMLIGQAEPRGKTKKQLGIGGD
jgi:anti-sigma28 factor (negative regulator of flagellin synthesis)